MAIDLTYDPVVREWIERTRTFTREHVLPIEDKFLGDVTAAGGDDLRRELQAAAKDAAVFAPHAPREYGGGDRDQPRDADEHPRPRQSDRSDLLLDPILPRLFGLLNLFDLCQPLPMLLPPPRPDPQHLRSRVARRTVVEQVIPRGHVSLRRRRAFECRLEDDRRVDDAGHP